MNEMSIELLKELTQATGIPGHEAEVQTLFKSQLGGVGRIDKDRSGRTLPVEKVGKLAPEPNDDRGVNDAGHSSTAPDTLETQRT